VFARARVCRCTVCKEMMKTRSVKNTGGAAIFDEVLSFKREKNSSEMKVSQFYLRLINRVDKSYEFASNLT